MLCEPNSEAVPHPTLLTKAEELDGSDPRHGCTHRGHPPLLQGKDASVSILPGSWSWKTVAEADIILMKFLALPNSTNRLSRLRRNDVLEQQFNKILSGRVKPRGF